MSAVAREVVALCTERLGFALAGVVEAAPSERQPELLEWLSAGKHGEMGWLAEHAAVRCDPGRFLPGCRSLILVADLYYERPERGGGAGSEWGDRAGRGEAAAGWGVGKVARYARGDDYHRVIKHRLHELGDALRLRHPEHQFRAFSDTAPVLEREHASRAGLGWIGKHTLLIHPRLGSYTLLGGVATTLHLPSGSESLPVPDHCGSCTRCIDACPTGAIEPYAVDASRCVSYLTIEHRSPIDPGLHRSMGDWLFGCDVCQEVCPHNSPRPEGWGQSAPAANPRYAARPDREPGFSLLEVLRWTEEDRRRALSGSAIKRARLDMLKRNALIAAANIWDDRKRSGAGSSSEAREFRGFLEALAAEDRESALVRTTAAQILGRLRAAPAGE
ncbi:MAG: tRNA epoxyqueuosine(34) reductase QueG [Phycisphaerales bacterium]|nr:tRNA epoxyqueuosine(34) reductase QueG [Phycisphaerales bacterium]